MISSILFVKLHRRYATSLMDGVAAVKWFGNRVAQAQSATDAFWAFFSSSASSRRNSSAASGVTEKPALSEYWLIVGGKIIGLLLAFNTLHDDRQAQRLVHGKDLRKNGHSHRFRADRMSEGLVDLDGVD